MIAAQAIAKGVQLVGIGPRHRKPSALRRKRPRDCGPDAATGAGNKRGHTGEIKHIILLESVFRAS